VKNNWESENDDKWEEEDGSNKSDAQDEKNDNSQGQSDQSQVLVASINSQGGVSAMIAQMIEASTELNQRRLKLQRDLRRQSDGWMQCNTNTMVLLKTAHGR
jgi:hypothetical protein